MDGKVKVVKRCISAWACLATGWHSSIVDSIIGDLIFWDCEVMDDTDSDSSDDDDLVGAAGRPYEQAVGQRAEAARRRSRTTRLRSKTSCDSICPSTTSA